MSLESALDRTTAAIERLIRLLESASWSNAPAHQMSDHDAPAQSDITPVTAQVTLEQCQAAAARAVERLGNTPDAKFAVKALIRKHGKELIKDLTPLQLNTLFSEMESL